MDAGQSTQSKGTRRTWTRNEEEALLRLLDDVVANGGKCENNGTFRAETLKTIEKRLQELYPDCGLRVNPHIESKMRKWKKDYGVIQDMVNKSGFAWNDTTKCIEVDSDEAWQAYVQHNKEADGWRGKSFPIFDRLANIFGKDRATGIRAKMPAEMEDEVNRDEENLNDIGVETMNDIDIDETSPVTVQNRPTATSRRTRKRNKSGDDSDASAMVAFKEMFQLSVDQLARITDKFVKGSEDRSDISDDLCAMGLSEVDHFAVFKVIIENPTNLAMFKSFKGSLKERFVMDLLREIRGD